MHRLCSPSCPMWVGGLILKWVVAAAAVYNYYAGISVCTGYDFDFVVKSSSTTRIRLSGHFDDFFFKYMVFGIF